MADKSRLVVTALPSIISKEELRLHFASLGLAITDARVLKNKNGQSRRVGFLGFQNNTDAQTAKEWFDGTWIAGSRIQVDFAYAAPTVLLEHSRQRIGESPAELEAVDGEEARRPNLKHPCPPQLEEDEDDSDAAYLAKRMKRQVGDPNVETMLSSPAELGTTTFVPVSSESATCQHSSDSSQLVIDRDSEASTRMSPISNRRLFVRNLAFSTTEEDVRNTFAQYGQLHEVHLPKSGDEKNKGIAFVQFETAESAKLAIEALDGKALCGRLLHILPASAPLRSAQVSSKAQYDAGTYRSHKSQKLASQVDNTFNWATLYMNSDAALDSLAARYNVSKAALLDPTSSNSTARLALAESFVIQEMKDYMTTNGVDTRAFDNITSRSKQTLLIKNMPAGSTSSTVKALLGNGNVAAVRRIVIPPAGVVAVVELETTQAASRAMNELAYRKLGNAVIYVERAPLDIWKSENNDTSLPVKTTESPPSMPPSSSTDHAGQSFSLFVSNLPTNTVTDDLDATFKVLPGYIFATVSKSTSPSGSDDKDAKTGGGIHGFIGFKTHEQAMDAIDATNGTIIGGRVISVAESNKNAMSLTPVGKNQSRIAGSKLVIKNLPFEVRKSELLQIVSTFGKVVSLRIPQNAQGKSRGFAFVHFASEEEAVQAVNGLRHSHVLGRHLIIESAQ